MRSAFTTRRWPWLAAAILATSSLGACMRPSQVYDVEYRDRHPWDRREESAYRRWETERTIVHIEFGRRPESEQRVYWTWRHHHPDQ